MLLLIESVLRDWFMDVRERLLRLFRRDRGRRNAQEEIERLGPWFYSFQFGDGLETRLLADWLALAHETRFTMVLPELDALFSNRWSEVSCLDAGCNEGDFGFAIAKRGAQAVVGFDARQRHIEKAECVQT